MSVRLVFRNALWTPFSVDELVVAWRMNSSPLMQSEGSLPRSVDRHLWQTNAGMHVVQYARLVRVCMYAVCTNCCIRRGPGGERILDVPGGTELEPRVKTGS